MADDTVLDSRPKRVTEFGKEPGNEVIDLASEAALVVLADAEVSNADVGILVDGNLVGQIAGQPF